MRQHFRPCGTCPFTNKAAPGETGGSPVEVYVGQTLYPFRIPCHECINYDDPDWKMKCDNLPQCVGHAMCRSAMGISQHLPNKLLRVEFDRSTGAFRDLIEFWAYHERISYEEALDILTPDKITELCEKEIGRSGARVIELVPKEQGHESASG